MVMGVLQVLIVVGAYEWLRHFNRSVRWWQMLLMYGCFASFCLVIAGGMTLSGEFETRGGLFFIGYLGVPHIIAGAIMARLFIFRKQVAG
jgi:hypothetical protein